MDLKEKINWSHTLWEPLVEHTESPLRSKESGIRVAAYCRISDGETNYDSLENQVSYFSSFIYERKNWKFIGVYIDQRKSGATISKRPGFQRMLRHAREGKIDLILTKSVSRFSRNTKDLLEIIQELKGTETTIYFERENLEVSGGKSSLMLETHAAMAQDFIESISNLVKFNYKKRLNEGRPVFGDMYGYDYLESTGKDMVKINEEEAQVVRWIFEKFIEGTTYAQISRELNEMGIRTKKGNSHWSGSVVRSIIRKIEYTGNKLAMKRSKDLLTGKVSETDNSQEKYLIMDSHPAIIATETFEKAQVRIKEVTVVHKKKRVLTKQALKNRVRCGRCGSNFLRQGEYNYACVYSEPSVNLCDVEKLKTFDPQAMATKGIFIRMMNLHFEIKKDRKGISYKIRDDLNRSEETLNSEFGMMINQLRSILKRITENDHFEFQRLRLFTQLEIARNKNDTEEIERIKDEYQAFEEKASRVEVDREYRLMAMKWLDSVRTIEVFIKSSTIEILRAWMLNLTIYSREAYVIEWIDGKVTAIGEDEISIIEEYAEKKKQERLEKLKISERDLFEAAKQESNESIVLKTETFDLTIKGKEAGKVESVAFKTHSIDERQNLKLTIQADVIKLEDGLSIKDLGNLKKNILKSKFEMMQQAENRKLRVAAYCRVSTQLEEQKLSLQTQLAYYNFKILSTPNWEFAGIYADEGVTGTKTEPRDDFNRMLEDARKGKIDMIITKSVSRFSRNVLDVLKTVKMLSELEPSVSIFFEKEKIKSDDPHASMILSLMATAAQEEVLSLSNSITWGIQNLAKRGEISRITDMYGYTIDKDRRWEVVSQEAETVRHIFKEYERGVSILQIIDDLWKRGIKSSTGKNSWDYSTVKAILMNEKYIGDYEFQKYFTPSPLGKQSKVNTGQVPKYYIEMHHDPIIERVLFDSVQKRIEANRRELDGEKKKDGTAGRPCFYKTFICSECGSLISRYRSDTYDTKEGSQWRCVNSYRSVGSSCDSKMFKEKYIDYNFYKVLVRIKNDKECRKRIDGYLHSLELTNEERQDKEHLEKEMESKNQLLYEAVDVELYKDGKNTKLISQITSEIVELRQRHQIYIKRLEKLEDDRTRLEKLVRYCERVEDVSFVQFHHMRPRIRKGDSLYLTSKTARDNSYMDMGGKDFFPEECFSMYVLSGKIDIEGRIVFSFADGLELGTNMTYDEYRSIFAEEKEKIHQKELLNSKEVLALKDYCSVGRFPKEIRDYLGLRSKISFEKRIKTPLCEMGYLRLEDSSASNKRRYIWVEDVNLQPDVK